MEINRYIKQGAFVLALGATIALIGMDYSTAKASKDDPIIEKNPVLRGLSDSTFMNEPLEVDSLSEDFKQDGTKPKPHMIYSIVRDNGDNIKLRWAPSDYITWKALNDSGYVVLRMDEKVFDMDTIAIIKPLTLEGFKAKFGPDDDLAAAAAEVIWGDHSTERTLEAEDNMNPFAAAEAAEDLDQIFSTAMVLAELRFDIAEAMGLGFVDRNVQKGHTYQYIVKENLPRGYMEIFNMANDVKAGDTYKPSKLDVQLTDSIYAPCNVMLFWPFTQYTVYDIERRNVDSATAGGWEKVNKSPFLMLRNMTMPENTLIQFGDVPPGPGVYEYRLIGFDSFGTPSLPSDTHIVEVPDMMPPSPPSVKKIIVDHPDEDHAFAHIYLHEKDSIEPDLVGYKPMYRPRVKASENVMLQADKGNRDENTEKALSESELTGEWHSLLPDWAIPTDSVFHCDVSGLPSGEISIMAIDRAGNTASSMEQYFFLEDFKAPAAPDSLRANVAPDGTVVLRWNRPPDLDVRYYDVYFANDTTHTFLKLTSPDQVDNLFIDSIAPGLNQAFIYYEVRAIDYSGNTSLPSNRLRVIRPNFMPPRPCRIDSLYNDEVQVYMRWVQPDEQDLAYTRLLRRKRPSKDWEVVSSYPADSVRAQGNYINITDHPIPDMKNRYEYAMEAYNLNGVSSGPSLVTSVLHAGPRVLDLPIKLMGVYRGEQNETVLGWELKANPEDLPNPEWWYCIYRKGPDDDDFKFLLSTDKNENKFVDYLLKPGQSAEYYVKIRFKDGRFSQNSNKIKVTAPNAN